MDTLDLKPDLLLVVKATTYDKARSIQASAVKAASRRLMALDTKWDGEWVRFNVAEE